MSVASTLIYECRLKHSKLLMKVWQSMCYYGLGHIHMTIIIMIDKLIEIVPYYDVEKGPRITGPLPVCTLQFLISEYKGE